MGADRDQAEVEAEQLFLRIGLTEQTAKNSVKNPKFRQALTDVIHAAGAAEGAPKARGALLYQVASKFPGNALVHRPVLLEYITGDLIASNAQLDGALEYLGALGAQPLDTAAFEAAAGVGVVVTPEQIQAAVANAIDRDRARLLEDRYHASTNGLLGAARAEVKWAPAADLKQELDRQVAALLGPKTEADMQKPDAKKKKAKAKAPAAPVSNGVQNGTPAPAEARESTAEQPVAAAAADPYAFLPPPSANNSVQTTVTFSNGRVMRIANTQAELEAHLVRTGGAVVTRFPPEPNGYLHIGHAKAMFVDLGMAAHTGGRCYLRFDDTNPEAEKQEYIDHIQEIIAWLGYTPWKVTYSSDYFDQLHALAVELIRGGNAYVDHQTADEIKESRERREPSPWRDRPVAESLRLFEDMRRGLIDEGKATLRMRMDHKNENVNMFDLIAYRIKFIPHPKAGDAWCIYPSYDFTHCLVDSLEDITHSLCTLEFESRRASYYWLLEVLRLYKPLVWEYSRLNITHTVMSKRKLKTLVERGLVRGWDDPRLPTLAAMRRRGYTPQAINSFCRELGVTRSEGGVHFHKLEHAVRSDADQHAPRCLAVLRPLRVVLVNLPEDHFQEVAARRFPQDRANSDTYPVPLTRVVYIEKADFRVEDAKDYYGLAPGKSAMLRFAGPIKCVGYSTGPDGAISELQAEFDADFQGKKPPKGVLNWVGQWAPGREPEAFEARLYDVLFRSEEPAVAEDWLGDLNAGNLEVVTDALATPVLAKAAVGDRFQLERLGYFAVDPDSRPGALVLNRTVTLKESFQRFGSAVVPPRSSKAPA